MKRKHTVALLATTLLGSGWMMADGPGMRILRTLFQQVVVTQGQNGYSNGAGWGSPPAGQSPFPAGSPSYAGAPNPAYPAAGNAYPSGQYAGYPSPSTQYPATQYGSNPNTFGTPPPAVPAVNANYSGYNNAGPAAPVVPTSGGSTIRIASFNIQVFGDKKASYAGIMNTLAQIIQNFQVVAIQEVRTQDNQFLDKFLRNYVNRDGRAYSYVIGPRLGRTVSTEQYAFIYDTAAIELNPNSVYTVNDPEDLLHREPLVAQFRVRGPPPDQAFTFILIDIHTDPDEVKSEVNTLADVYQVVRKYGRGEDDIILLGDLNADDQHLAALGQLPNIRPIVHNVPTNSRRDKQYDNIIVHGPSTVEFTGNWGVYDVARLHNLSLEQVLQVSDHQPVWAEFSAYEGAGPGRFAGREGDVRAQ